MIIVSLKGGLGNQMFQYALGLALSVKHSVPLKLDLRYLNDRTPRRNFVYRDYDLDIFGIPACQATAEDLRRFGLGMSNLTLRESWLRVRALLPIQRRVYQERIISYDERVMALGGDAYLSGYWQTEKYFSSIAPIVRERFTVSSPYSQEVEDLRQTISSQMSICVNVRRTDFVNHPTYQTTDVSYFNRAVKEMNRRIGSDCRVFIFSDDVEWCRSNLHLTTSQEVVDHRFAGPKFSHYFALMSACRHFIIPNSTFAWWAAWLSRSSGKIVIGPRRWIANLRQDTRDVLPAEWVVV